MIMFYLDNTSPASDMQFVHALFTLRLSVSIDGNSFRGMSARGTPTLLSTITTHDVNQGMGRRARFALTSLPRVNITTTAVTEICVFSQS